MQSTTVVVAGLIVSLASATACSKSDPAADAAGGSGISGTYTSVEDDALTVQLEPGGVFGMAAAGMGSSSGTYTVDGEKVIVTVDGQTHNFVRDGGCIEDRLQVFGKLCKGGKAGAAANVSTREVPKTPSGTYVASNADGEFRLEFQPGNKLILIATPVGGQPDRQEGTFIVEGDVIHATVGLSVPLVLRFVNNTYESTSFGFPMTFVKR